MTTKDYKPPMVPKLEPCNAKLGAPPQIRISKEYGASLKVSGADEELLRREMTGESICPAWYWFRDTPEVRRILKVEEV